MPRYIELDDDEQEKIGNTLEVKAIELGLDKWEKESGKYRLLDDLIGICANCDQMRYCTTEFGDTIAHCYTFRVRLTGRDRIIECNEHRARGTMTLRDMETIATLIDVDDSEIGGFISNNPKLRKAK